MLSVNTESQLSARTRLALCLYQCLVLSESTGTKQHLDQFTESRSLAWSRSQSLSWSLPLFQKTQLELFEKALTCLEKNKNIDERLFVLALEHLGYRYSASDWFQEQADNPDLMIKRGLKPGEPLPETFQLFDAKGMPVENQHPRGWLQLREWLADDEAVLGFVFPKGLSTADETLLRNDLQILKTQPWSPQAAVDAILEDWPEEQEFYDVSLESSKQNMLRICEEIIATTEKT